MSLVSNVWLIFFKKRWSIHIPTLHIHCIFLLTFAKKMIYLTVNLRSYINRLFLDLGCSIIIHIIHE